MVVKLAKTSESILIRSEREAIVTPNWDPSTQKAVKHQATSRGMVVKQARLSKSNLIRSERKNIDFAVTK